MSRSSCYSSSKPHPKILRSKRPISRNPLKDLNAIPPNSSSSSSSLSIEAPRGCLPFLLSHSSSSSSSTKPRCNDPKAVNKLTPKSAPDPRKFKENSSQRPLLQKVKRNPLWQSGRKPISAVNNNKSKNSRVFATPRPPTNRNKSGSTVSVIKAPEQNHQNQVRISDSAGEPSHLNFTPLGKGADASGGGKVTVEDDNANTSTPPIQTTVSPEIQCGLSVVSATTTPLCYAAGHVLSKVADKRKCKPRGILTIGHNPLDFDKVKTFDNFDSQCRGNSVEGDGSSRASLVPSPLEASMRWLLPPFKEDGEDQKEDSEDDCCQLSGQIWLNTLNSPRSPSPLFPKSCEERTRSSPTDINIMSPYKISPCKLPEFFGCYGCTNGQGGHLSHNDAITTCKDSSLTEGNYRYDLAEETSPFSVDSLGTENVMRTPQSESSSEKYIGFPSLKSDRYNILQSCSATDSMEHRSMTSLSAKTHPSILDSMNTFPQSDDRTCSTSIDAAKFQRIMGNGVSWISNSTSESTSLSEMRISWREGLVSRIFEIDEFDCCRCFSDEEEDNNSHSNDLLGPNKKNHNERQGNPSPHISYSVAESISTDGDALFASGDSDWTLCYKNRLFEI